MSNPMTQSSPTLVRSSHAALDTRQHAALETTRSLLTSGERIEHAAFQLRLRALLHRRVLLIATDRRVLVLQRRLIGGFHMHDIQWQDVREARVREHVLPSLFGADLEIVAHDGRRCTLIGGESSTVRAAYAYAQGQEQAWREKHRVRKMEELRAEAGGVTVGNGAALGNGHTTNLRRDDVMAKLREAKALLDERAITDVEYESLKAKILAGG
ncbi:MAG: PH domain-containing protein [Polyangiales bacterium]